MAAELNKESEDFNERWAAMKNEFARREAEQEAEAFLNDPDMRWVREQREQEEGKR